MKQRIVIVLGMMIWGTTLVAEGMQAQEMPTSELIKQNRQIVKLASEEISKTLPQKVDNYTVLQKVLGKDTTLTYVFEINTGAKSDETVKKEDHSRMKKAVTKGICQSSKRFLDAEINISYVYKSTVSKAVLFQFDVSKDDCMKSTYNQ
jgi:hypothetical protein